MAHFTVEQIYATLNNKRHNIRHVSVIAHVDHGKATLTNALATAAGVTARRTSASAAPDEPHGARPSPARGGAMLHHALRDDVEIASGVESRDFLINLIDSPGEYVVDSLSASISSALRVSDGALYVVDCVEGLCVSSSSTPLGRALNELVRPVLVINKMDRALLELQLDPEELYRTFVRAIDSFNAIASSCVYHDTALGDVQAQPERGGVAFASGLHGWGFTLRTFARMYAIKFGVPQEKLMARLWGESYWDPTARRWNRSGFTEEGKPLPRAFCQFVLRPIYALFDHVMTGELDKVDKMLGSLGLSILENNQRRPGLVGKPLLVRVMQKFLPIADALLEMVVLHLPSPVAAQRYRVDVLYEGPLDDEAATAIRNCDPDGPLMIYVSRMIPAASDGADDAQRGRLYALGRVFSGRVATGQRVRIMSPKHQLGRPDLFVDKLIQRMQMVMVATAEGPPPAIDDCPCGNLIGLIGIDPYLFRSGTITTSETAHSLRDIKFSVSPVVRVTVEPTNPADLPHLVRALKRLARSDPCVRCDFEESGQHVVAGSSELHLEICLIDLRDYFADSDIKLRTGEPVVSLRETVTARSDRACMAKSPNGHNRLYLAAKPLADGLSEAIEYGEITLDLNSAKTRLRELTETYDWDVSEARKIWCFGPETAGPNALVNATDYGQQQLNEIKDSFTAAFQWATKEGVLCGESMRGIQFNIHDAVLHADAIHRGGGQIIPTARRVIYACELTSEPRIMEPVYLVELRQCTDALTSAIFAVLFKRRGHVIAQDAREQVVKAYLPVAESFGFTTEIRYVTRCQVTPECVFDHWQVVPGDPTVPGLAHDMVLTARAMKGLAPAIPSLDRFLDVL
jgi:elongation factor 2